MTPAGMATLPSDLLNALMSRGCAQEATHGVIEWVAGRPHLPVELGLPQGSCFSTHSNLQDGGKFRAFPA